MNLLVGNSQEGTKLVFSFVLWRIGHLHIKLASVSDGN